MGLRRPEGRLAPENRTAGFPAVLLAHKPAQQALEHRCVRPGRPDVDPGWQAFGEKSAADPIERHKAFRMGELSAAPRTKDRRTAIKPNPASEQNGIESVEGSSTHGLEES